MPPPPAVSLPLLQLEIQRGLHRASDEEEDVGEGFAAHVAHHVHEGARAVDAVLLHGVQLPERAHVHGVAQNLHLHDVALPPLVDRSKDPDALDGLQVGAVVVSREPSEAVQVQRDRGFAQVRAQETRLARVDAPFVPSFRAERGAAPRALGEQTPLDALEDSRVGGFRLGVGDGFGF